MQELASAPTDIRAIALPVFMNPNERIEIRVPPGTTLGDMVDQTMPDLRGLAPYLSRVSIDGHQVPLELWDRVKPKSGSHVLIEVVPGNSATLRSVLTVVVAIAAVAAGQFYGPGLAGALQIGGNLGNALASASLIPGATIELDALGQRDGTEAAAL